MPKVSALRFFPSDCALTITVHALPRNFALLDMRPSRFRIVSHRDNTESADAHLHAGGLDRADTAEVRFDKRKRCADGLTIRWLSGKISRANCSNRGCPPLDVPIILTASTNTFGLFASIA